MMGVSRTALCAGRICRSVSPEEKLNWLNSDRTGWGDVIDFFKSLLCVFLAQCYDSAGHREMQRLNLRAANLERDIAAERAKYWRPRDTFGGR